MKKIAGLIGFPLGHTLSPKMHNAVFDFLKIDAIYLPLEVQQNRLKEAIDGVRALNFIGVNVTIPYKEAVIDMLDEVTDIAKLIGAVNTVVNKNGKLVGYNTDGPGFIESLKEDASFDPIGKSAIVIGCGGAGRAVAMMLASSKAKKIFLVDADTGKCDLLAEHIRSSVAIDCVAITPNEIEEYIKGVDLLVNASPIGMSPKINDSPLPNNVALHSNLTVYDLVYNPRETKLLSLAKKAGATAVSGIGMLVRQGKLAFELFTDQEAPFDVMYNSATE